jgi:hypothetical protein
MPLPGGAERQAAPQVHQRDSVREHLSGTPAQIEQIRLELPDYVV